MSTEQESNGLQVTKKLIRIKTANQDKPVIGFRYAPEMDARALGEVLSKVAKQYEDKKDSKVAKAIREIANQNGTHDGKSFPSSGLVKDLNFKLETIKGEQALVADISFVPSVAAGVQ